jgi:hypothetical protein
VRQDEQHYCDICGEEVPSNQLTSRTMLPQLASLLLDTDDPDLAPTWTQLPDGTIQIEFCATCRLSMGGGNGTTSQ